MLDKRHGTSNNALMEAAKTAKHYPVGTRISHREYGPGVVTLDSSGRHWPMFDNGTRGTTMTRVTPLPGGAR